MRKLKVLHFAALIGIVSFISACQESEGYLAPVEAETQLKGAGLKSANSENGFVHGIALNIDGDLYYLAGAPDGPNGETDVPGHYWVKAGKDKLVGKHYNSGPFGAPKFWSSDAPDGEYLFKVDAIIDEWTEEKAEQYADRGFVHYHELVQVSDGSLHPHKVLWLKHIAVTTFTLDGGPMQPDPGFEMTPGVAYNFMPNYFMPYHGTAH